MILYLNIWLSLKMIRYCQWDTTDVKNEKKIINNNKNSHLVI